MRFSEIGFKSPDSTFPAKKLPDSSPIFLGSLVCGKTSEVLLFYLDQQTEGYNAAAPYSVMPKDEIYGDRFDHTPLVLQSTDQNISAAELEWRVAVLLAVQSEIPIDEKEIFFLLAGIRIIHPHMCFA